MAFYERLVKETAAQQQYLLSAPIINDVFEHRFTLETYVAFLNQAFHHVKHTVPLLMLAGGRLSKDQRWLESAIAGYIQEEAGHELWILDDLEACGCDRAEFAANAAPHHSDVMVSYLYDNVQRRNPVGIFGMVLVLEGTSASLAPAVADIVQASLNLPDTAMTYLRSHGELDQDHIQHFENIMNQVEDPQDQADIIRVARTIYQLYGEVYRAIPAEATALTHQAAA